MNIVIVHLLRSGKKVPKNQLFNLGRGSKKFKILSNDWTHLPLNKTKALYQVQSVEEAIKSYSDNLYSLVTKEVTQIHKPYTTALRSLYTLASDLHEKGLDIYLGCWCKDELDPKPSDHECHCDYIKKTLLNKHKKEAFDKMVNTSKKQVISVNDEDLHITYVEKDNKLIILDISTELNGSILFNLQNTKYDDLNEMCENIVGCY